MRWRREHRRPAAAGRSGTQAPLALSRRRAPLGLPPPLYGSGIPNHPMGRRRSVRLSPPIAALLVRAAPSQLPRRSPVSRHLNGAVGLSVPAAPELAEPPRGPAGVAVGPCVPAVPVCPGLCGGERSPQRPGAALRGSAARFSAGTDPAPARRVPEEGTRHRARRAALRGPPGRLAAPAAAEPAPSARQLRALVG